MKPIPLRYEISDWSQLSECMSNYSRDLSISVTKFLCDPTFHPVLGGTRIQVQHPDYGVLFSCIVGAFGTLVMPNPYSNPAPFEFTPAQIEAALAKYGFFVKFRALESIPKDQKTYLHVLEQLKFDKIRVMATKRTDDQPGRVLILAFKTSDVPAGWFDPNFSENDAFVDKMISAGCAFNCTGTTVENHFSWSWLRDCVMNISDAIKS